MTTQMHLVSHISAANGECTQMHLVSHSSAANGECYSGICEQYTVKTEIIIVIVLKRNSLVLQSVIMVCIQTINNADRNANIVDPE